MSDKKIISERTAERLKRIVAGKIEETLDLLEGLQNSVHEVEDKRHNDGFRDEPNETESVALAIEGLNDAVEALSLTVETEETKEPGEVIN